MYLTEHLWIARFLRNIKEAIQGYLEAFPEDAERLKLKNEVAEVSI